MVPHNLLIFKYFVQMLHKGLRFLFAILQPTKLMHNKTKFQSTKGLFTMSERKCEGEINVAGS